MPAWLNQIVSRWKTVSEYLPRSNVKTSASELSLLIY